MPTLTTKQEIFERMVNLGFDPIKNFIEYKRLAQDLTDLDIERVVDTIEYNLLTYIRWLRHQDSHKAQLGREDF